MRLMNADGKEIPLGTVVHAVSGPYINQPWRLEGVNRTPEGEHRIHASRSVPRHGRVHKEFHPHVFGLAIVVDITWRRRTRAAMRRVDDYFLAGLVALVPLAFFERFHMAETITSVMGMHGH